VSFTYKNIFISNSDPQWKAIVIKIQIYTHPSKPNNGVEKETDSPYSVFLSKSSKITSDEDKGLTTSSKLSMLGCRINLWTCANKNRAESAVSFWVRIDTVYTFDLIGSGRPAGRCSPSDWLPSTKMWSLRNNTFRAMDNHTSIYINTFGLKLKSFRRIWLHLCRGIISRPMNWSKTPFVFLQRFWCLLSF